MWFLKKPKLLRSVEFLEVPSSYYDILEERLKSSKVELQEDMDVVILNVIAFTHSMTSINIYWNY